MRILLAEDEKYLSKAIAKILCKNNCSVDTVYNGADALEYLECGNYDALILDIMMPVLDGISVLRQLRERGSRIPVLVLTAKSDVDERVLGLDSGADYYLTKPFDSKELLACLRVITRSRNEAESKLYAGNITLDRTSYELKGPCGSFKLANKEFQMMQMLMSNPKMLISADRFMENIWGFDSEAEINVVWVYISYLRKKLIALGADIEIKASRNVGYSLEEKDDKKTKA